MIEETLNVARSQIGQKEVPKGSNRGPMVTQYQRVTGYTFDVPWCLCFLYWCAEQAARNLGSSNPLLRTGDCDTILRWGRERDIVFTEPKVGDFGLVMASETDATHIFVVEKITGAKMTTIEGNTNNDGSREGYAVLRRSRNLAPRYRYLRWGALAEAPSKTYSLSVNGQSLGEVQAIRGVTRAPVRTTAVAMGIGNAEIAWDDEGQGVAIRGKLLPSAVLLKDGVSLVPLRELVTFVGTVLNKPFNITVAGTSISVNG